MTSSVHLRPPDGLPDASNQYSKPRPSTRQLMAKVSRRLPPRAGAPPKQGRHAVIGESVSQTGQPDVASLGQPGQLRRLMAAAGRLN